VDAEVSHTARGDDRLHPSGPDCVPWRPADHPPCTLWFGDPHLAGFNLNPVTACCANLDVRISVVTDAPVPRQVHRPTPSWSAASRTASGGLRRALRPHCRRRTPGQAGVRGPGIPEDVCRMPPTVWRNPRRSTRTRRLATLVLTLVHTALSTRAAGARSAGGPCRRRRGDRPARAPAPAPMSRPCSRRRRQVREALGLLPTSSAR